MLNYKSYNIHLVHYVIIIVYVFIIAAVYAQEAENPPPIVTDATAELSVIDIAVDAPPAQSYQITSVDYNIKGLTRKYPLSQAVPIDTAIIFDSKEALQTYLDDLEQRFKNLRVIQSVRIDTDYGAPNDQAVIPVMLTIAITDTWNFIAVPYPSFDSNSGFKLKLKMQDFNFVGMLQPLKADIVYRSTETNQQILSSSVNFALPFKAGPFNLLWDNSFQIIYAFNEAPKINIGTGLTVSHKFNKRCSLIFGFSPELMINDRTSSQTIAADKEEGFSLKRHAEQAEPVQDSGLGHLYPDDRYYFKTPFFVHIPIMITEVKNFGRLVWTPSVSLAGNWAFDGIQADDLKSWIFGWGHGLSLSRVNWEANFRKGLSFSVDNTYAYQFYNKQKMNIGFTASLTGYYPFVNRVGIYGQMQFFYRLFGRTTMQAGSMLRGILNKRIKTDTAFTFNLDIPIRIASLDFQTITGVAWTRFFNCDVQLSPFLDIALVHDKKTGRYYHPADGWYAGGLEAIVYPEKMRSIYVRASLGFDLTELKNLSGIKGRAKRDGEAITEIFVGIGLHY